MIIFIICCIIIIVLLVFYILDKITLKKIRFILDKADKSWMFGLGNTIIWTQGSNLFYRMPWRKISSIEIGSINSLSYHGDLNEKNGKITILRSAGKKVTISVPSEKHNTSNDFVEYIKGIIGKKK
jgi:hypothetical protein